MQALNNPYTLFNITAPFDGYYEMSVFHLAAKTTKTSHLWIEVNGDMKCATLTDKFTTGSVSELLENKSI